MSEKERKRMKTSNLILNIVLFLAFVLFIWVGNSFVQKLKNPEAEAVTIFGYVPMVVLSDSMYPAILPGALVIGQQVDVESIQTGDVITFNQSGKRNTHRVTNVSEQYIYTKGDNTTIPDGPLTKDNFRYKIVLVGNWAAQLRTIDGIIKYVVLPITGLIMLMVFLSILGFHAKKRKKLKTQATESEEIIHRDEISREAVANAVVTTVLPHDVESGQASDDKDDEPIIRQSMTQPANAQQLRFEYQESDEYQGPTQYQEPGPTPAQILPQEDISASPQQIDWRDEIFKDVDLSDVSLDDISLHDIDLDDFDLDDVNLDDIEL